MGDSGELTELDAGAVFGGGLRWWADSAPDGPEGLGLRFIVTLLYPR